MCERGVGEGGSFLPGQFQPSVTNSENMIGVQGTSKGEVLIFGRCSEQPLCGFVEPFGDMV